MSWRAHGSRAWLMQRISAVYLAVYIVMFGLYLVLDAPTSYQAWRAWMGLPFITVATSVFFAALLMHAWVGLRDVIMDYARPPVIRFILLASVALGLFAMGLWVLRVLMLTPTPTSLSIVTDASGCVVVGALAPYNPRRTPCGCILGNCSLRCSTSSCIHAVVPLATLVHPCTA